MTNKSPSKKPKRTNKGDDAQAYRGVGIAFAIAAVAFLVSESTRTLGIVFGILALTFIIIASDSTKKPKKK